MTIQNNQDPIVSIIVITYNSSKYVLETLESAKEQTYQNIELIVSDDCSSDNTVEICREWLQTNKSRFVRTELVTVEKNTGIPANCNRGVKASHGEWIKLIAGDDTLTPICVLENIKICQKQRYKVLQTNLNYFRNSFLQENYLGQSSVQNYEFFMDDNPERQYKMLLYGNRVLAASMFIKKEVFSSVGDFDESITLIEDLPFWTKLTGNGIGINCYDIVSVNYRKHDNNTLKGGNKVMQKSYAQSLLIYSEKYKRNNVNKIHYYCYNVALRLIVNLHGLKILNRVSIFDILVSRFISVLMKIGRPL